MICLPAVRSFLPGLVSVVQEFLCVRTQSLSTVKTQNLILHNMFKHTLVPSGGARGLMERFISGLLVSNLPELVRFLREILDTLFCMLANPTYVREQEWIFRALLHMLVITTDKAASLPGTYGPYFCTANKPH